MITPVLFCEDELDDIRKTFRTKNAKNCYATLMIGELLHRFDNKVLTDNNIDMLHILKLCDALYDGLYSVVNDILLRYWVINEIFVIYFHKGGDA